MTRLTAQSGGIEWGSLYYGDCLTVMSVWDEAQADLIYLDPPFNSSRDYNVLYGTDPATGRTAQKTAFGDTWVWDDAAAERSAKLENLGLAKQNIRSLARCLRSLLGECPMLAYLTYMIERLTECQRVLKKTGSIYLHCDDTAAHYLKIVMDTIFEPGNYLNDITWRRATSHNDARRFGRICDRILFYAKNAPIRYWNNDDAEAGIIKSPEMIADLYSRDDKDGRGKYRVGDLTGRSISKGESGRSWRNYDVTARGRCWSAPLTGKYAEWIEQQHIPNYRAIKGIHARLDALDKAGFIHHPRTKDGWPGLKRYAEADSGQMPPQNLILHPRGWTNFNKTAEYLGYETQKPVKLLRPLIAVACPPGGTVLDPFCGCGTTVDAAHSLGRRWAGVDLSVEALRLTVEERLQPQGLSPIKIHGIPQDLEAARQLATTNPFKFEAWLVDTIDGLYPNEKQTSDKGIDGRGETYPDQKLVIAQVSASLKPTLTKIRDFAYCIEREYAAVGIFLTLDYTPTPDAKEVARKLGEYRPKGATSGYSRLQFISARDVFDKKTPNLPPMTNPYTGKEIIPDLFSGVWQHATRRHILADRQLCKLPQSLIDNPAYIYTHCVIARWLADLIVVAGYALQPVSPITFKLKKCGN